MTYTIGSLFSGYGGLDLAVEQALGHASTAWVSDIEPGPQKVLARRWHDAPNLGDITEIDWTQVEPVDVIAGGSPCQDLSMAGRRAGMKPGTRSGLWESMFAAICTIRPHLVVWENVRGAFSAPAFSLMESREGRVGGGADGPVLRALGRVLGDLASIGYDAQWHGLRASDVGAPHQRYRVFIAAHPEGDTWWLQHRDGGPAADPDGERGGEGLGWPAPDGGAPGVPVESGLRAAPDAVRTTVREHSGEPSSEEAWSTRGNGLGDPRGERTTGERGEALADAAGGGHRVGHSWGRFEPAIRRWELILGREAPSAVIFGPHGKLQLSPYFDEWVMGLDAGWICDLYDNDELSRNDVLRLCGNGVVPQQAAAAIRLMRDREVEILRSEVAA